MFEQLPNVPVLLSAGTTLVSLGVGIWFGRASASDRLAAAQRMASATSVYAVRAESARSYIKAIETPTQMVPVVELVAATETRAERLKRWAHELVERTQEAVTPEATPPDWAEGEMTAAFRAIVDGNEWGPVEALPQPSRAHELPVPALSAPPPLRMAPRGPQTPPRWQDGGTPPTRRRDVQTVSPRDREWAAYRRRTLDAPLMPDAGPIPLPEFPRAYGAIPAQRHSVTPLVLANLPADDTRQFRVKQVAA